MSEKIIQLKKGEEKYYPLVREDCVLPMRGNNVYYGKKINLKYEHPCNVRGTKELRGNGGIFSFDEDSSTHLYRYLNYIDKGDNSTTLKDVEQLSNILIYDISDDGAIRYVEKLLLPKENGKFYNRCQNIYANWVALFDDAKGEMSLYTIYGKEDAYFKRYVSYNSNPLELSGFRGICSFQDTNKVWLCGIENLDVLHVMGYYFNENIFVEPEEESIPKQMQLYNPEKLIKHFSISVDPIYGEIQGMQMIAGKMFLVRKTQILVIDQYTGRIESEIYGNDNNVGVDLECVNGKLFVVCTPPIGDYYFKDRPEDYIMSF